MGNGRNEKSKLKWSWKLLYNISFVCSPITLMAQNPNWTSSRNEYSFRRRVGISPTVCRCLNFDAGRVKVWGNNLKLVFERKPAPNYFSQASRMNYHHIQLYYNSTTNQVLEPFLKTTFSIIAREIYAEHLVLQIPTLNDGMRILHLDSSRSGCDRQWYGSSYKVRLKSIPVNNLVSNFQLSTEILAITYNGQVISSRTTLVSLLPKLYGADCRSSLRNWL
jgi:hypothetical protein